MSSSFSLTEDQKSKLKEVYEAFAENKRIAKDRNSANTDLINELTKELQFDKKGKKAIRAAFKYAMKQEENGDDEVTPIVSVLEQMN